MWLLLFGSLPAAVIGYILEGFFESLFGEPGWVAFFLLVTAGLLALSEWLSRRRRGIESVRWPDALVIGLGQAAAIAPGISRSGATISAGLLRGLERPAAARFSFLLATPIILGAGLLQVLDLFALADPLAQVPTLAVGFATAAISGYASIWGLLRFLQRGRLYPFAIYCALFAAASLMVVWVR
jgi:undecaprenyl-diphosphatase